MDVMIHLPNGDVATRAEIGVTHLDIHTLEFTVPVIFYSTSGDVVYQSDVLKTLNGLPIPDTATQWAFVMPLIENLQSTR
jgi:hypothetical protein